MALWQEYNDNSSPEAHLVKALDKAETIIQHNQGKNQMCIRDRWMREAGGGFTIWCIGLRKR